MDWPKTTIDRIPASRFRPPHCPWRNCPSNRSSVAFRYNRVGYYSRNCDRRTIPRFRCKICNEGFSQQTFSLTYYLKKPHLLARIAPAMVACSAARQIARSLGCSHTTVVDQGNRIGRHALLLHSLCLDKLARIREKLVFDHAEMFEYCQERGLGVGTAVGQKSWFLYTLDPVVHRMGGEMTPGRLKRLKKMELKHGRVPAGSYRASTERAITQLLAKVPTGELLHLVTDGKPEYQVAAKKYVEVGRLHHETYPNPPRRRKHETKSDAARERDRAMFPVDHAHKMIRHSNANHKRETIAHGRRANSILLRLFVYQVWKNLAKDQSERSPRGQTPAMEVGLLDRFLDWRQILGRRLFPWRQKLSAMEKKLYTMAMVTPAVGRNRLHDLINAF